MVHTDRAIHVDDQQSTTLVQVGGRETDAKLQRHQGQTAFATGVAGIERLHLGSALTILRLCFDLIHHLVPHPVFDQLVVLGGHGVGGAADLGVLVEVELADLQRVFAQGVGDVFDHTLDAKHALRATKAAKRGRTLGVGFAAVADQLQRRDVITVVDVQTRAVVHRTRIVGAVATSRHQRDVGAQDASLGVKAHLIVDPKIMALAGDGHVVIAVDAQLDGFFELVGGQCGALAEDAGVAFLAPKAPAHAAADHLHIVGGQIQSRSGLPLIAVRVLGRTIQGQLAIFTRHGVGDLAFQIKLLLLARAHTARHTVRRRVDGCAGIATGDAFGRHDEALCGHRLFDGQDGGQGSDLDLSTGRRLAGIEHFTRHHHRHRLPDELHLAIGQERVVVQDGTTVVFTWDVACRVDGHHPMHGQDGLAVDALADQLAMRHRRLDDGGIQSARQLGDVIGVSGLTRHMQVSRLVDDFTALL